MNRALEPFGRTKLTIENSADFGRERVDSGSSRSEKASVTSSISTTKKKKTAIVAKGPGTPHHQHQQEIHKHKQQQLKPRAGMDEIADQFQTQRWRSLERSNSDLGRTIDSALKEREVARRKSGDGVLDSLARSEHSNRWDSGPRRGGRKVVGRQLRASDPGRVNESPSSLAAKWIANQMKEQPLDNALPVDALPMRKPSRQLSFKRTASLMEQEKKKNEDCKALFEMELSSEDIWFESDEEKSGEMWPTVEELLSRKANSCPTLNY